MKLGITIEATDGRTTTFQEEKYVDYFLFFNSEDYVHELYDHSKCIALEGVKKVTIEVIPT